MFLKDVTFGDRSFEDNFFVNIAKLQFNTDFNELIR